MSWSVIYFGSEEIKGKTLPQIIFSNTSWFFWAVEEGVFNNKGRLAEEAREINYKARNIKIPQPQGKGKLLASYFIHPHTHDLDHIVFTSENIKKDIPFIVRDRIDLSVPFEINCYDKKGGEILIEAVKTLYFKDKSTTKTAFEDFFENKDNFIF